MAIQEKIQGGGQTGQSIETANPHQWVSKYADYLYAYALVRVDEEEQAKDLVQETFLAALKGIGQFESKSTERTWLTAILRNKIVDHYRKKSFGAKRTHGATGTGETITGEPRATEEPGRTEEMTGASESIGTNESTGIDESADFFETDNGHWTAARQPRHFGIEDSDPILNKELREILEKCLKRLPASWFSIFTMKHMEDLPTDTICAEMKVSPSNFWVVIHRAKVHLRECLQRNWI